MLTHSCFQERKYTCKSVCRHHSTKYEHLGVWVTIYSSHLSTLAPKRVEPTWCDIRALDELVRRVLRDGKYNSNTIFFWKLLRSLMINANEPLQKS